MNELSVFVDESGDSGGISRYYLLCLVLHEQIHDVTKIIAQYENSLLQADLPNIIFHSEPLLNGRKEYRNLNLKERKKLFGAFASLVRYLPIKYISFAYKKSEFETQDRLSKQIKSDILKLLEDNLSFFQKFDTVKIYYDNGQEIVKHALDESFNSALSKGVVKHKKTSMTDYRLEQAADYLCTIELARIKYDSHENGSTYNKFFGGIGDFKKNWLKQVRRKKFEHK